MFVHVVFKHKLIVHEPWGASLFHLEYSLTPIIYILLCPIGSLDLLIACLLHLLKLPSLRHLFAIFDPKYGLASSKYS
jgi:hypothetical protein